MNWASIGKKLVKAKQLGKNLNEVNLGKYEPTTKAKRDKLAKVAKVYKKGMGTKQLKRLLKIPNSLEALKLF